MKHVTEEIWNEFSHQLKFFIKKRIADENDAEDLLQEVFIKVHQNLHKLEDANSIKAWLYQVTRNAIIDFYRQPKLNETVSVEFLENLPAEIADEASVDLTPCLQVFLNQLPYKYKKALEYTEYRGFTQKQLAEELGISVSGAKSQVQRAREKLKTLMGNCCAFEQDARGNIIDYQKKDSCKNCNC